MKKLLLATALAGSLAACTPDQSAQTAAQIAQIRSTATQICGYLPTVSTVVSILGVFVPSVGAFSDTATQIAGQICGAVTAKSARRGGGLPVVQGVAVHGKFVR
jgi:hypothetical protein